MSRLFLGPDPAKVPSLLLVQLCHHLLSTAEDALLFHFSSSRKKMPFLLGPQSWEYRSKLLSYSFQPLVLSVDLLIKVPEGRPLDAPTSLPGIPSWSSFPTPPLSLQQHRSSAPSGVTCLSHLHQSWRELSKLINPAGSGKAVPLLYSFKTNTFSFY